MWKCDNSDTDGKIMVAEINRNKWKNNNIHRNEPDSVYVQWGGDIIIMFRYIF